MVTQKKTATNGRQSARHDELIADVNTHLEVNDLSKAYLCLEELAAMPESCVETSTTAGLVALTLDYQEKAKEHFINAIKLSPRNFDANYNLFLLRLLKQDYVSAKKVIDGLIDIFPTNSDLYSDRAILWTLNYQPALAFKDFICSLALNPNSEKVLSSALSYMLEQGMCEEGMKLVDELMSDSRLTKGSRNLIESWRGKFAIQVASEETKSTG